MESVGAAQRQVEDFHQVMGLTIGFIPDMRDRHLRAELLSEEAFETIEAIHAGDFVEAIDGLVDLIYVALGAAVAWGVDLEPYWQEVHRANMRKAGGGKRADGKALKPPDWQPPDISGILASQMGGDA